VPTFTTTNTPIVPTLSGNSAMFNTLAPNMVYSFIITASIIPPATDPGALGGGTNISGVVYAATGPPQPSVGTFTTTSPVGVVSNSCRFTIPFSYSAVSSTKTSVVTSGASSFSYTIDGVPATAVETKTASKIYAPNSSSPSSPYYSVATNANSIDSLTAAFSGLSAGSHTLVVTAVSAAGSSSSTPYSFLFAPEQPVVNVTASNVSYDRFTITWSGGTGATSYVYSVDTVSPPVATKIPSATAPNLATFTGVLGSTTYYVSVLASNSAGSSPVSTVISVTTPISPPGQPVIQEFSMISADGFTV
jgi:hypothetical protein